VTTIAHHFSDYGRRGGPGGGWSSERVWAAAGSAMETVQLRNPPRRQLKKLDEDSLTKQPEEVFDVLEKLGEGSMHVFIEELGNFLTKIKPARKSK